MVAPPPPIIPGQPRLAPAKHYLEQSGARDSCFNLEIGGESG